MVRLPDHWDHPVEQTRHSSGEQNDYEDPDGVHFSSSSCDSSPLYYAQEHDHNGEDKQNMDQSTHRVRCDQTKQPEEKQDNYQSAEHHCLLSLLYLVMYRLVADAQA
jgi:hypothetical protein